MDIDVRMTAAGVRREDGLTAAQVEAEMRGEHITPGDCWCSEIDPPHQETES